MALEAAQKQRAEACWWPVNVPNAQGCFPTETANKEFSARLHPPPKKHRPASHDWLRLSLGGAIFLWRGKTPSPQTLIHSLVVSLDRCHVSGPFPRRNEEAPVFGSTCWRLPLRLPFFELPKKKRYFELPKKKR